MNRQKKILKVPPTRGVIANAASNERDQTLVAIITFIFRQIIVEQGLKPLISNFGLNSITAVLLQPLDDMSIKQPAEVDTPLNKEAKRNQSINSLWEKIVNS